jgi:hypothetical protein
MSRIVCKPKSLTLEQAALAARRSIDVNPANAEVSRTVERSVGGRRGGPRRLALLTGSRWPATGMKFTVQFLDNPSPGLKSKILEHMNAWSRSANVSFEETRGVGMVRIARLDRPADMAGYWSYVGTQILGIEADQPTLNLDSFTLRTPDAEFFRVVRHEVGHALGFEHEHMRRDLVEKIDRKKAISYYRRECDWTREETIEQVLTPLDGRSIMGTRESDPTSIMCYEIPAEITKNGRAIVGGTDITEKDSAFAAKIYPKPDAESAQTLQRLRMTPETLASTGPAPPRQTLNIVVLDGFDSQTGDDYGKSLTKSRERDADRPKYARVFASYGGARVTHPMRLRASRGEEPTPYGSIIAMHERIKSYTNVSAGSLPSDEEMLELGKDLFHALFQGDVRRLYDEARARQQNRKLDIVFTSMIPWIAEKPWEFAYDPTRKSFLATEEVHFVRNVLTAAPADEFPPKSGPLRILVASAQPVGSTPLSAEQEAEVIRRGFVPLIDAQLATVSVVARATPGRILGLLSTGGFDVVHLISHGQFDEDRGGGSLFFENENGGGFELGERSVREIFCKRGVSLVFLNACQTGASARDGSSQGVAQALVSHGVPAVVANQYSVLDSSATSFAQHFYWALAQGFSLGQAACDARIAVNYALQGESIDWAVPVVYARDPDQRLCIPPTTFTPPATAMRTVAQKAMRGRAVRVAVWDIDNVFPKLDETLAKMNFAQDRIGFELATLSAPIDSWYLGQKSPDGGPYLWAEKLAARLGRIPAELGVRLLACITRHWLCDDDTLNLYGWWPSDKKPPVVIFSCAGFDDLQAEGPRTDQALANVAVSALAGFLGDLDAHERGAKYCPLYYDEERNFDLLVGRQKFDASCRAKLKKTIPRELPALEKLLKAFPISAKE